MKAALVRVFAFLVGIAPFALLQVILWRSPTRGTIAALFHHPGLWVVYFLPILVVAEQTFNFIKRRGIVDVS